MTDRLSADNPSPEEQFEEPLNLPVYDEETQERFKASMADQNVVTMVPEHLFAVVQREGPDRRNLPHWLKITIPPRGSFDRTYHLPVRVTDPDTGEVREVFRPLAQASLRTSPPGSIGALISRTWYKETDGERYGYVSSDAHPNARRMELHLTPLEQMTISWRATDGECRSFIFQPDTLVYSDEQQQFVREERPRIRLFTNVFDQLYDPEQGVIEIPDEGNDSTYIGRYNPVDEQVYLYQMRRTEGNDTPIAHNEIIIPRFSEKEKMDSMFPPELVRNPTTNNLRLDQGWMRESPQGASGVIWRRLR